jgi:hypothetical protein
MVAIMSQYVLPKLSLSLSLSLPITPSSFRVNCTYASAHMCSGSEGPPGDQRVHLREPRESERDGEWTEAHRRGHTRLRTRRRSRARDGTSRCGTSIFLHHNLMYIADE